MKTRLETLKIKIGGKYIGGSNNVLIQSMCNIKTSKIEEVSAQINRCASLGADIMRLSCLDLEDAKSFAEIKKRTTIPLVADIHFQYEYALEAIKGGVDAIRINPGNIGSIEGIKLVIDACKEKNIPIRIGVNSGSLDKSIYQGKDTIKAQYLVDSAKKHVKILEDLDFHNIVISLKGSSVIETIEAYRLAAKEFPYPLHIGITEPGPSATGLIRSAAGLAPLLLEGLGDTIRISLTDEPEEEIRAAKRLLHDLGLYPNYPTFISCPTCGRTQVNLMDLSKKILNYLEEHHINKEVAIMGCIVNGPGEARHADIGAAGGKSSWAIFKKGEVIETVPENQIFDKLVEYLNQLD